ncbi:hypothetical protein TNCV_595081 [Trichonephila clavipes]|nr:hypothetical protein TNCV_595081 [Trichonephila clavipes]
MDGAILDQSGTVFSSNGCWVCGGKGVQKRLEITREYSVANTVVANFAAKKQTKKQKCINRIENILLNGCITTPVFEIITGSLLAGLTAEHSGRFFGMACIIRAATDIRAMWSSTEERTVLYTKKNQLIR